MQWPVRLRSPRRRRPSSPRGSIAPTAHACPPLPDRTGTFTLSTYDVFMRLRGLPNLPVVHMASVYKRTAQDLMDPSVGYLTLDSTFEDAKNLVWAPAHCPTRDVNLRGIARVPSLPATRNGCAARASSMRTTPSGLSQSLRSSTATKIAC